MTHSNHWRSAIVIAAVVVITAVPMHASHSWGNYHWARTANPFTLKVHDNVTSAWDSYLVTALSDWTKSTVLDAVRQPNALSSPRKCSSAAGVIEVCNERYGQNGWLGIAGISASGGHITKAYTKLNDTYFAMAQYNTPAYRAFVTCQEIGHDFGLAHQDENFTNANLGSCMDYTNNPTSNQHPNNHDYDMLQTIYSHLDSTSTISMQTGLNAVAAGLLAPVATDSGDGNEPWEWGTPVGFDNNGRANRFRHVKPNGDVELVHVLWADVERGKSTHQHE